MLVRHQIQLLQRSCRSGIRLVVRCWLDWLGDGQPRFLWHKHLLGLVRCLLVREGAVVKVRETERRTDGRCIMYILIHDIGIWLHFGFRATYCVVLYNEGILQNKHNWLK
jgi:hypothetical protein